MFGRSRVFSFPIFGCSARSQQLGPPFGVTPNAFNAKLRAR